MTTTSRASVLALVVGALILGTATPAEALFIETPLHVQAARDHAEVGDGLDFVVGPNNASAGRDWANKDVKVGFTYDRHEGGAGPDEPTSDTGQTERILLEVLRLGDGAQGRFTWTVPAEVDDRNVGIFLEAQDGSRVAFTYIAIGDATPMMHMMGAPSGGEHADGDDADVDAADLDRTRAEEAPALGVTLLAALAGAALVVARRRV